MKIAHTETSQTIRNSVTFAQKFSRKLIKKLINLTAQATKILLTIRGSAPLKKTFLTEQHNIN